MVLEGPFIKLPGILTFLLLMGWCPVLYAGHVTSPLISIIIDDIGYRHIDDAKALSLPGPVTYAIMPHAPHSVKLSNIAHDSGKTVILHLPMEAMESEKNKFLGPGALKLDMKESQFINTLSENLDSIPNIIGVNNHMGSLLTSQPQQMEWLMEFLFLKKILFVDSVTSSNAITRNMAKINHVPYLKRDVFLDNHKDKMYINSQFLELVKIARRKGSAIAIGHPHPETIGVLAKNLADIDKFGVKLVSLVEILDANHSDSKDQISMLKQADLTNVR